MGHVADESIPMPIGRPNSSTSWPGGRSDQSREDGLSQARESRHLFSIGHALSLWGRLSCYQRNTQGALMQAEEAISLSEQNAMALWLHWGQFNHGWARSELGQLGQGV